ncbi:MAG: YiiD C-terminal domain-containing protein [Pseudomonadota bacterium]
MNPAGLAAELEQRILAGIPLARAMQVRLLSFDGERVVLEAPFAPNVNDKGTGFAGSLATLVTLSGWSLATLLAEGALSGTAFAAARCEAAVYRSELEFLRPVRETLRAEAWLATPASRLRDTLLAGRRAKLAVAAELGAAADPAVRFRGGYAVWRAGTQPF